MIKKILCSLFVLLLFAMPAAAMDDFVETSEWIAANRNTWIFGPFEAENLNGDGPVTEAIFADAELTFINFWATWCPPCVAEIPALAQVDEESGGNVRVIGVLMDGIGPRGDRDERAIAAMRTLLDRSNAEFPVLFPADAIVLEAMSVVHAVPTTFVVNREGVLVDGHVGAMTQVDQWLDYAQKLLDEADA